jgi:hypothetical protein
LESANVGVSAGICEWGRKGGLFGMNEWKGTPEFLLAQFVTAGSVQKKFALSEEINQRDIQNGDGNDRENDGHKGLDVFGQTDIAKEEGGRILQLICENDLGGIEWMDGRERWERELAWLAC